MTLPHGDFTPPADARCWHSNMAIFRGNQCDKSQTAHRTNIALTALIHEETSQGKSTQAEVWGYLFVYGARLKSDKNCHVQICDEVSCWVGAHRLQTCHGTYLKVKCVREVLKGYSGRREQTSWKTQRKMVRCSGQGWYEDVEVQELEKVGRG